MLDTGASANFMDISLYNKLCKYRLIRNVEKIENNMKVITANGSEMVFDKKCTVKLRVNKFTWLEEFYVGKIYQFEVILGTPYISRSGLMIDLQQQIGIFKFAPQEKIDLIMENNFNASVNNCTVGFPQMIPEVDKLLKKYESVFTDKIGKALDLQVDLQLTDNTPVNIRPYPLSVPNVILMKDTIDNWLKEGIIKPSTSSYSSPAFLTKNGRLVINYTELNKKLVKVNYPIGDLQNMHQHLRNGQVFTVLDLNKAFLQCPLTERSRPLTAFSTSFGKYEFARLPFGLQAGSATLSYYMDQIFRDIKFKYVINFCDDIVIYSPDCESHVKHLDEVLKRLEAHKLTVNPKKAKFFCKKISFLGHVIENNTICVDPDRTAHIRNFPTPKRLKDLKRFIGGIMYWSRYIPNVAEICKPLNALKKKNAKFIWSPECDKAFNMLKERISNPPILQIADFSKEFIVQSDASKNAAAGCLLQRNDKGDLLPIAYHSKRFTNAELRFSIYEKEAYAALICIEKWREFLEVKPFKLMTDNQALSYVLNSKRKLGRLSRWTERLLDLPFEVIHIRGSENVIADALSRMYESEDEEANSPSGTQAKQDPNPPGSNKNTKRVNLMQTRGQNKRTAFHEPNMGNLFKNIPLVFEELEFHQKQNEECVKIAKSIEQKTNQKCYFKKNGIIMYNNGKGNSRIYLPENLINLVYSFYHETIFGGHVGKNRTISRIQEFFYNPELENKVSERVKSCKICLSSKGGNIKYEGTHYSNPALEPLDSWYIDLFGPLPVSKSGNKYVLIVVDGFTKYVWFHSLRNGTSSEIINRLQQIIANFSMPKAIVSDNAKCFTSEIFRKFLFRNFIRHRKLAAYRPNGNIAERYLRELSTMLRCYHHDSQNEWDRDLGNLQLTLNNAFNHSSDTTAFKLMFNFAANDPLLNSWRVRDFISSKLTPETRRRNMKKAVIYIKKSIAANKRRSKYFGIKSKHPFKINDLVLIKSHHLSKKADKFSRKLALKYEGPYRLIYFISEVTVLLQRVDDPSIVVKRHIVDLKMYYE